MDWRKADNCVRNGFHATVTFMKTIEIAIALIIRNENGKRALFAARRNYGEYEGFWEFPGGKLEAGEIRDACIVREMREELSLAVIKKFILEISDINYRRLFLLPFSETARECSYTRNNEFKLYRIKADDILNFNPDVYAIYFYKLHETIHLYTAYYLPLYKKKCSC